MSLPSYALVLVDGSKRIYVEVVKDIEFSLFAFESQSKLNLKVVLVRQFPTMVQAQACAHNLRESGLGGILSEVARDNPSWRDLSKRPVLQIPPTEPGQGGMDAGPSGVPVRPIGPMPSLAGGNQISPPGY